jgi:hypothetical protein
VAESRFIHTARGLEHEALGGLMDAAAVAGRLPGAELERAVTPREHGARGIEGLARVRIERVGDLAAVEAQPALATLRGHMQQTARAVQEQQLREVEQRQQAEFTH